MELIGFGKIEDCKNVNDDFVAKLNVGFNNATLQVIREAGWADSDLLLEVSTIKEKFNSELVATLVRNFMEAVEGDSLCQKLEVLVKIAPDDLHTNILKSFRAKSTFIAHWLIENLYSLAKTPREAFEDFGLARDLYYDALMAHRFTQSEPLTPDQKAELLLKSVEISKELLEKFPVSTTPNLARTSDPTYVQYMEDLTAFPEFRNSEILKHPTIFAKYAEIRTPNLTKLKADKLKLDQELTETRRSKHIYQGLFAGSLILSGFLAYKLYKNTHKNTPKIRFPEPDEEGHQYVQLELPIKR